MILILDGEATRRNGKVGTGFHDWGSMSPLVTQHNGDFLALQISRKQGNQGYDFMCVGKKDASLSSIAGLL